MPNGDNPEPNADVPVNNLFIKNYGLFWKRDNVDWGEPLTRRGALLGKEINQENSDPIDFRDQIGFYALYNIRDNRDISDPRDIFNDQVARNACNNPYCDDDKLIYCGHSGSGDDHAFFQRMGQQRNLLPADSWNQFSWFGILDLGHDGSLTQREENIGGTRNNFLFQMEAVMIAISRLIYNLNAGDFKGAKRYVQYRDTRLDE